MFSMLDVMELGEVRSNLSEFPTNSLIDSVVAKFTTTATNGKTYKIDYYNLNANIAPATNKEKRMCMHIRSLYPPQMRE